VNNNRAESGTEIKRLCTLVNIKQLTTRAKIVQTKFMAFKLLTWKGWLTVILKLCNYHYLLTFFREGVNNMITVKKS
jgi:hypothetical protein